MTALLALGTGAKIVLMILFLLALVPATYFLFLGVRKDHKRFIHERQRSKDMKREEFDEYIKNKIEADEAMRFGLIFVEFNAAKEFKDHYGDDYYAGALGTIREKIASALPKGTKVCLYEYDTYAFLLDGDIPIEQFSDYTALCVSKARTPVPCGKKRKEMPDVIVGSVRYETDDDDMTHEVLLRDVEIALAVSGRAGLNNFVVFTPELLDNYADYHYYRELKDAINANEFTLYFQPIRNLFEGETIAYESMLRWNHGEHGELKPEKFMHVIERSGDINWVGLWAYEQLLIQYSKFIKLHPASKVAFSTHLSFRQINDPKICDDLYRITTKYDIDPCNICFEVGEVAVLNRIPVVAENLEKLVQCGFMTAVDDFGLEESAVIRLSEQRMFDWIKINPQFTDKVREGDPDIKNIQALLEASRALGFLVMVKDIQDGLTEEMMRRLGIFCGQGYYLGKPEPFEKYMNQAEAVMIKSRGKEPKWTESGQED